MIKAVTPGMLQNLLIGMLLLAASTTMQAQTFSDAPATMDADSRLAPVRVEGNRFVNPQGETMVFRGLAFSDPHHLAEQGKWNKGYFEAARDWNANIVRIPVHPDRWRDAGHEQFLSWLDEGVQWATELGMYVIIDWHTIGNPLNGIPHRPGYLTTKEETFYFWYQIANRYKGNSTVAFYELFNEPTNRDGAMGRLPWAEYKQYIEDIIFMIRNVDPDVIPLVAGFDWAYELRHIRDEPIDFPGIAYVSHPYPQKREPPWEEKWEQDWGYVADTYPIIATEFGFMSEDMRGAHIPVISDEKYGVAITDYFNRKGISWTVWVFDPRWTPNLLQDWDFNPTEQGQFFKEILQRDNR